MKTQNSIGLYNNDARLWQQSRPSYKKRGVLLNVVDGHIHISGEGFVARFSNDDAAKIALEVAGYKKAGRAMSGALTVWTFKP